MTRDASDCARIAELEEQLNGAHQEIERLRRGLADSTGSKNAFLAAMNHELRTPLNHIVGLVGVMLLGMAGELPAEQRTQLEMVNRSARSLLTMVEDVLDLTELDAGTLPLLDNTFTAEEVIGAAIEVNQASAKERGLYLVSELEDEELLLSSDRRRLRQMLSYLISNALKFTSRGGVTVSARREGDRVRFSVSDTGRGMSPYAVEAAFGDFFQLPSSDPDVAKNPGMGLGLAISRRLARLLGTRLTAHSEVGVGTTILFDISAAAEDSDPFRLLAGE